MMPPVASALAAVAVLATVAFDIGFDETVTAKMVVLSSVGNLAGCALVGFSAKYISPRLPILVGSLSFLLLPLIFTENSFIFLLVYAVVFFGRTLVDNGVPLILRYAVPAEIAALAPNFGAMKVYEEWKRREPPAAE